MKVVRNKSKINLEKLQEANNVIKPNSECVLIVTEGLSAANFFESISQHFPGFHDNFGVLPL